MQRQVEYRIAGAVPGIEQWAKGISDGIGRRHEPSADNERLADICKDRAVIADLEIGLLCGRIIDVHAEGATEVSGLK